MDAIEISRPERVSDLQAPPEHGPDVLETLRASSSGPSYSHSHDTLGLGS